MPHGHVPPDNGNVDSKDYCIYCWSSLQRTAQKGNRKLNITSQVPDLTSFPFMDNSRPRTCPTDLGVAGLLGSNTSMLPPKQKNDNYISASSNSPARVVDRRREASVSQLVKILLQLTQRLNVCNIRKEHEHVKTKASASKKRLMERVLFQDFLSNKRHDEMTRDLSEMYITRQTITNGEDMINKTIDINLLQECNSIEHGPPLSQEKTIHQDPSVKGLSKYVARIVARKDVCLTNSEQIFNILSKEEADDVGLQRTCSEGTKSGDRTAECSNSSDTKSAKDSSSSSSNINNSNSSFSGAGSSDQAEDDDGDEERGNGRKGMEQRKGKCKKQRKTLRSKLKSRLRLKIMAGLRSRFFSILRRKFWRVIPKTLCSIIVDGPRKNEKGGHFVGFSLSQTARRKNSLKPPASRGQARERQVRRKSSFQDSFSSSRFPQDQLSKFKNGPWISNALRVRSHVLVAGASCLVQLLRQRSGNADWGKRRNQLNPSRGRTKRGCWQYGRQKSHQAIDEKTPVQCTDTTQGEFCGTPSAFSILDIGDSAALVTPHPNNAAPPPRLKLRRGYTVHQQCDEDLGMQGQTDRGLRPASLHAGTEDIEDDVNDVQLHEERADNRLLHILIVVIMGIILYTPLWSSDFTDIVD